MEAPVKRSPLASSDSAAPNATGGNAADANSMSSGTSVLKKFALLLGTKGHNNDNTAASTRMKELSSLLSSSAGDDEVVLTVPSLDLRLTEGEQGKNEVLPQVGEHAPTEKNKAGESRPCMTASVLSLASDGQAVVELKAAQNIGKRTSWTRSTVSYASSAVGSNISDSFTTLLNSRLRAWTLLLLRHSLSTGSGESRSRLLSMLAANIQVKSVETKYKTLPLPPSAKGAKPKDSDIILPLLFEVLLYITIQDKPETVTLRAPGTVSAIFAGGKVSEGLKKVHIQLDTGVVLKSMVDQARIVVLKAVANATNTPVPATAELPKQSPISKPPAKPSVAEKPAANSSSIGSFRTSMNNPSPVDESTRLQKARSSALRLNSVLHGRSAAGSSSTSNIHTSTLGLRKVRSVKWDHPVQAPNLTSALAPNPKKIRLVQTAAKLKSFKSFGRPHAGDFGSGPRNATFGEYGRPAFAGSWGRDGRLAQHPMPGMAAAVDPMGNMAGGSADKNATFDNLLPGGANRNSKTQAAKLNPFVKQDGGGRSAAASGAALLGRATASKSDISSPGLPRTATALENSLMKKWSS